MTKNQIKSLKTAGMVCALLLVPATLGVVQQMLARRKMVQLATAEAAVPAANGEKGYGKLTFDLLKSWTYIEGKTPIPGFIKELDGKNVVMLGFMMPLTEVENIKEFLLVPSLWGCCYGQPPAVNHIVAVKMKPGEVSKFYSNPIKVKGRFSVGETKQDGYVGSLYVITVDKIVDAKGLE